MKTAPRKSDLTILRDAYEAHGYIRVKMDKRMDQVRSGWELRLLAREPAEARALTAALRRRDFIHGSVFEKRGWQVIPIYGKAQVQAFLKTVRPAQKQRLPTPPAGVDLRRKQSG